MLQKVAFPSTSIIADNRRKRGNPPLRVKRGNLKQ
jgi:hypothetical protein